MKIIAHRGNIGGPSYEENCPHHISATLSKGYDVEVDFWLVGGSIYLGHDSPEYEVNTGFLEQSRVWCHAKNAEALEYGLQNSKIHCFWHEDDEYTLTSKGYAWVYPGKLLLKNSICVKPELGWDGKIEDCYGICTDFAAEYREKYI